MPLPMEARLGSHAAASTQGSSRLERTWRLRAEQLRRLTALVGPEQGPAPCVLISGGTGTGKTALVRWEMPEATSQPRCARDRVPSGGHAADSLAPTETSSTPTMQPMPGVTVASPRSPNVSCRPSYRSSRCLAKLAVIQSACGPSHLTCSLTRSTRGRLENVRKTTRSSAA